MTANRVVLAIFTCTEVESSPMNRRLDEPKTGEHVSLGDGVQLFISDPAKWGAFKVGAKYELRAEAEPKLTEPFAAWRALSERERETVLEWQSPSADVVRAMLRALAEAEPEPEAEDVNTLHASTNCDCGRRVPWHLFGVGDKFTCGCGAVWRWTSETTARRER